MIRPASLRTAAAVVVVAALSGCGLVGGDDPGTGSPAAVTHEVLDPKVAVNLAVLGNADVSNGYVVKLMPKGDKVEGQRTLDWCGRTYKTEKHRIARRQVAMVAPSGEMMPLSNEVVAYDSEAHAAAAMKEFRAAVGGCSATKWVKDGGDTYRIASARMSSSSRLPVADNVVVRATVVDKTSGRTAYTLAIFQRKGAVLDAFYLFDARPLNKKTVDALMSLAITGGTRLAAT